jgi:hypothetical protein
MRRPIFRSLLAVAVFAIASMSLVQLASARPNGQAATKTVQVKCGEFFFRLSTKSLARPGKVVFVFKNVGHVEHDFKINRKRTPLLQRARRPGLSSRSRRRASIPTCAPFPDTRQPA